MAASIIAFTLHQIPLKIEVPFSICLPSLAKSYSPRNLLRAETILASMRGTFGADACRLLQINTGRWPGTPPPPDVWSAHRLPRIEAAPKQSPPGKTGPPEEQALGAELSDEDIGGLRDFVADLAVKQIIPQMEQKIRALNHTVRVRDLLVRFALA